MSSAYCMTCNDQVLDLAGSCPEGHPIGAEDTSPQPWVGHADASGRGASASPPPPPAVQPVAQAQPVAEASNGHANGHANGHTHAAPAVAQVTSFTPDDVDEMGGRAVHRAPANGEAADELAAMLASALASTPTGDRPAANPSPPADTTTSDDLDAPWVGSAGDGADTPAASSGTALPWTDEDLDDFLSGATSGADPATDATPAADATSAVPSDADASDRDWDDLASLAAELQLDGAASAPADQATPPPAPEVQLPDSLVDLPPPAPPTPPAPVAAASAPVAPAPAPPAVAAIDTNDDLDTLSDQDLAALYESAVGQHLDEAEHVPSEPMTPPAPEAADTPAVTVDLANFTARGNSVARNSAATRRFGRKR